MFLFSTIGTLSFFFKCKSTSMNHSPSVAVLSFLQLMSNHSAHNSLWFIHERDCFIRVSKHEETDERTRQRAECFYCIRVFRNPDETRSPSLWNGFSKGSNSLALNTKAKQRSCLYLVFPFFCFLTLLKHEQICWSVWWKMFLWFLLVQLFYERQSHFALPSSVTILNSGRSYAGTSLASFDHQKKPKRSFFARTFEVQKYSTKRGGSTVQREVGCWGFQKLKLFLSSIYLVIYRWPLSYKTPFSISL